MTSIGDKVEKLKVCSLLNSAATMENSMVVPYKMKHRIAIGSRILTLGIYSKELKAGLK